MENNDKNVYTRRLANVLTQGDYNKLYRTLENSLKDLLKRYPWYNGLTTSMSIPFNTSLNLQVELKTKDGKSYSDLRSFLKEYPHDMEDYIVQFINFLLDKWCYNDIYSEDDFLLNAKIILEFPYREFLTVEEDNYAIQYQRIRPSFIGYFQEKIMNELVDTASYKNAVDEIKRFKIIIDYEKLIIEYIEPIDLPLTDNEKIDSKIRLIKLVLDEVKKLCYKINLNIIAEYNTVYF